MTHEAIGTHVLLEGETPDADLLKNAEALYEIISHHLTRIGATVLHCHKHTFQNNGEPAGVTMAFVLAESHCTIHTYPEVNKYFLDIFTCGTAIIPAHGAKGIAENIGGKFTMKSIPRKFNDSYFQE